MVKDLCAKDNRIADKMDDLVHAYVYKHLSKRDFVKAVRSDPAIWDYVLDFKLVNGRLCYFSDKLNELTPVPVDELVKEMNSSVYSESIYGGF